MTRPCEYDDCRKPGRYVALGLPWCWQHAKVIAGWSPAVTKEAREIRSWAAAAWAAATS